MGLPGELVVVVELVAGINGASDGVPVEGPRAEVANISKHEELKLRRKLTESPEITQLAP